MTTEIAINENVLDMAVNQTIRPLVEKGVWDDPKAEGWVHKKMLPAAQPCLTQDAIREDSVGDARHAIAAGTFLLSPYEIMFAKTFLDRCDANKYREQFLDLLYGNGELEGRIRSFLDWACPWDHEHSRPQC